MTYAPVLPMPMLALLFAITSILLATLAWRGSLGVRPALRVLLAAIYLAVNTAIFAFLANPGTSVIVTNEESPVFLVAVDHSTSMNTPDGDDGATRHQTAAGLIEQVRRSSSDKMETQWARIALDFQLAESADELARKTPDGKGSVLARSLSAALDHYRSSGRTLAGILLLSDGRETIPAPANTVIRKANNMGAPIHTVCIGGDWSSPDIEVLPTRSLISGFENAAVSLGARIKNTGLGRRELPVLLWDEKGAVIDRRHITINAGENILVQFNVKCGNAPREYRIHVPPVTGEQNHGNNTAPVSLRIMTEPIKVFMAEGAPYWDSKFLAQLLRRERAFNVKSVHRLTDNRFFQLNTSDATEGTRELDGGLPTTLDDFRQFDIIVIGKGAEHMITPERALALQAYVRDFGGLLIFARGKSYAGEFPQLSALEPFTWKNVMDREHRFTPSAEGEDDNLFGQLLPGRKEPVWESLPPLTDVWDIDKIQPFTRILARSDDGATPMLAVRRVGLGAVVIINGDGMWKWDFYPEAKKWGNCYEDFWTQFLQWTQTSSEFLPGYNLSLRAERLTVPSGQPVVHHMSWRGGDPPASIDVKLMPLGSSRPVSTGSASSQGVRDGMPRWTGQITAPAPGHYILRADIPHSSQPSPELKIIVPHPPSEHDNLNADPPWMAALSETTGGRTLKPSELAASLDDILNIPDTYQYSEETFTPCWNKWYYAAIACALLAAGWWIRRRHGLL